MKVDQLKPNIIIRGLIFPELVKIITTIPMGDAVKLIGKGMKTGKVHELILTTEQLDKLEASTEKEPFYGNAQQFRLGIEKMRFNVVLTPKARGYAEIGAILLDDQTHSILDATFRSEIL